MPIGNKYNLEKVLHFASQKVGAGFNVKPSEQERKTDLWSIVSKAVNAGWLVQKKGTHDYLLTVVGYLRLLSEKAHFQDQSGNLTKLEAIREESRKISLSFMDGVNPLELYSPQLIDDVIKNQTLPQLLTKCLLGVGFSAEFSQANRKISDALSAGFVLRKNGDTYQVTPKGVAKLSEMRISAAQLDHRKSEIPEIQRNMDQAIEQLTSYIKQESEVLKHEAPAVHDMINMLSEAVNGSVSAIGVLLLDETRSPSEMITAAYLISEQFIRQVGEDDSGKYMEITDSGKMELLNMQLKESSTPEDKQFYRQQIYTEQKRQEIPIHTMNVPDGVMEDLGMYRMFVLALARLHFTERQLSFINELAVDLAFSDKISPGDLVEQWQKNAQSVTYPEEISRRRQEVLSHCTQWLLETGINVGVDGNAVNAMDFARAVKDSSGWHLPYHEAESILSEAKRICSAEQAKVAYAPSLR